MRTLPITAAEVPVILAAIQSGEHVWLVQEGQKCAWHNGHPERSPEPPPPLLRCACDPTKPPVEFTLACAPCETCGNSRWVDDFDVEPAHGGDSPMRPCTDCRIELLGPCPMCGGNGMIAHCGRTDNGSDGPCVLGPHADNFPCYGEGDVASDWSPVSWCSCGVCSCGSHQAWTEEGPCGYCHERPRRGITTLGHAYAVGEPLPIYGSVREADGAWPCIVVFLDAPKAVMLYDKTTGERITDRLSHCGPPESLVGKWALQLAVQP